MRTTSGRASPASDEPVRKVAHQLTSPARPPTHKQSRRDAIEQRRSILPFTVSSAEPD